MNEFLSVGLVIKPHGVRGQLKVEPLTDDPARFEQIKSVYVEKNGEFSEYQVESCGFMPTIVPVSYTHLYPVGIHVASITSGGPAEEAGLKVYDVIVEMDGQTVSTFDDIQAILDSHQDGDVVEIVVLRDNVDNRVTINITLRTMQFDS